MYNDFSPEEIEEVLEVGLEKVAYEEGLAEYGEALEKVASVHDVDPMALHDFLEKEAAGAKEKATDALNYVKGKGGDALGYVKGNPLKTVAGLGALGGAAYGGKKLLDLKKKKQQENNEKTAAAFGLDGDTFEYLMEQGIEALTE